MKNTSNEIEKKIVSFFRDISSNFVIQISDGKLIGKDINRLFKMIRNAPLLLEELSFGEMVTSKDIREFMFDIVEEINNFFIIQAKLWNIQKNIEGLLFLIRSLTLHEGGMIDNLMEEWGII